MKIAIYARKSKATLTSDSIETQIKMCKEYLKFHDTTLNDKNIIIYKDEGFSAKDTNRPMFREMISDIKNNIISIVICYKLDRISRNVKDFSELLEMFNIYKVKFISIKESFDTSTPIGRAMIHISSVFAQLERETIAERIKDNKIQIAKHGRWQGGIAPTGYKSIPMISNSEKNNKNTCFYLVQDESNTHFKTVKEIFDLYLKYKSIDKVRDYLNLQNKLSLNQKKYSNVVIKQILLNPVYVINDQDAYNYFLSQNCIIQGKKSDYDGKNGLIAYGKTTHISSTSRKKTSMENWIIAIGKHKGIIDGKSFVSITKSIEKNKKNRIKKSNVSILSEITYCSCGAKMIIKGNRKNKNNQIVFYYSCPNKNISKSNECTKNIRGDILDKITLKYIINVIQKYKVNSISIEKYHNETNPKGFEKTQIRRILEETKNKITKLINTTNDKNISQNLIEEIKDKVLQLNKKSKNILGESDNDQAKYKKTNSTDSLKTFLFEKLICNIKKSDFQTQRLFINIFIKKVVCSDNKIIIRLKK